MKKRYLITVLLLTTLGVLGSVSAQDATSYDDLKLIIGSRQQLFANAYKHTSDDAAKAVLLDSAGQWLFAQSDAVFEAWMGTPWRFDGNAAMPGSAAVSDFNFIKNTLKDFGFKITSSNWDNEPPTNIVSRFTGQLQLFSPIDIERFEQYLERRGNGLYLVCFDRHIGYVEYRGDRIRLIHANYYQPETGVMSEVLDGVNPLASARRVYVGKLFSRDMITRWITAKPYN